MANRSLQLLKILFNFAVQHGYDGRNPASRIQLLKEKARSRILTPKEIKAFVEQCHLFRDKDKSLVPDALLFSLFTGARIGNIRSATWDQFDLENRSWTIPDTKNNEPITIYFSDYIWEIVQERHERSFNKFAFASFSKQRHLTECKYTFRKMCEKAGIENFRIHDLKRTFVSAAYHAGLNPIIVQRLAGHRGGNITERVYGRATEDELRKAYQVVCDVLVSAIEAEYEE